MSVWMPVAGVDVACGACTLLLPPQFLAAMGPPGGGRNPVTNRYLRHFHVLYATEFDAASLSQIFGALTDWWFGRCK